MKLEDPPNLVFWAYNRPNNNWAWYAPNTNGTRIRLEMEDKVNGGVSELNVRLNAGVPTATFTSASGANQILTPVSSATAPGTTAASG